MDVRADFVNGRSIELKELAQFTGGLPIAAGGVEKKRKNGAAERSKRKRGTRTGGARNSEAARRENYAEHGAPMTDIEWVVRIANPLWVFGLESSRFMHAPRLALVVSGKVRRPPILPNTPGVSEALSSSACA